DVATHDRRPGPTDPIATGEAEVAVRQQIAGVLHGHPSISLFGDVPGDLLVRAGPRGQVRQQPVEAVPGTELGPLLTGAPTVVAAHADDVHSRIEVSQHLEASRQLLTPVQERPEDSVLVRLDQLVMDVAADHVAAHEDNDPGVLGSGEVIPRDADNSIATATKPGAGDLPVISVELINLVGVDDLIEVSVAEHSADGRPLGRLALTGLKPLGRIRGCGQQPLLDAERLLELFEYPHCVP